MRYWIMLLAYCVLAVVATGCASTVKQEFIERYTFDNGETAESGYTHKMRTGAFSQEQLEQASLDWTYGEGDRLIVGQQGVNIDNSGQIEAVKSINQTAAELLPAVLQLGPVPSPQSDGFGPWLAILRALTGGDGAVLSALLRLLGV